MPAPSRCFAALITVFSTRKDRSPAPAHPLTGEGSRASWSGTGIRYAAIISDGFEGVHGGTLPQAMLTCRAQMGGHGSQTLAPWHAFCSNANRRLRGVSSHRFHLLTLSHTAHRSLRSASSHPTHALTAGPLAAIAHQTNNEPAATATLMLLNISTDCHSSMTAPFLVWIPSVLPATPPAG